MPLAAEAHQVDIICSALYLQCMTDLECMITASRLRTKKPVYFE